jgi:hypothetical protein
MGAVLMVSMKFSSDGGITWDDLVIAYHNMMPPAYRREEETVNENPNSTFMIHDKLEPLAVTDAQYRVCLLDTLGVCETTDPAHGFSIEELEEHIVSAGMQLPVVRRISPPHPTCIDVSGIDKGPGYEFVCGPDCPIDRCDA